MPASGKSTLAIQLAAKLGFLVSIGTDEIRDVVRLYDDSPAVAGQSHDRWQLFGSLTDETYVQGYVAQSQALRPAIMAVIDRNVANGESLVVEGVHLLPSLYRDVAGARLHHFVLQVSGPDHHWANITKRLTRRQGRGPGWDAQKVQHVSRTQAYLLQEAKQYQIPVIPTIDPSETLDQIVGLIS